MTEPSWVSIARRDIGAKEIPGAKTAPLITKMLARLGAWWRDDETPWCGVAVGYWFAEAGIEVPKAYYRAKAWLDWGEILNAPVLGCVVIFTREGGGHVGLVVGKDQAGRLLVLGGNQSNSVGIAPFNLDRLSGYRWPPGEAVQLITPPLIYATAETSANEA